MLNENCDLYNSIASIVSEISELRNPQDIVNEIDEREDQFRRIQNEIKTLYRGCLDERECVRKCESRDLCGELKEFNCSSGKCLSVVQCDVEETLRAVDIARKEIDKAGDTHLVEGSEKVSWASREEAAPVSLESLSTFEGVYRDLFMEFVGRRDPLLEENLSSVISKVKDFQQVIESLRRIHSTQPSHTSYHVTDTTTISNLLNHVDRLNYTYNQ